MHVHQLSCTRSKKIRIIWAIWYCMYVSEYTNIIMLHTYVGILHTLFMFSLFNKVVL